MTDEGGASALIKLLPSFSRVGVESSDGLVDERVILRHSKPDIELKSPSRASQAESA
jgi:hypothetical protein